MRNVIIGSFVGFVLAAGFLAACGGGGGVTPQANLDELTQQVADLQSQLATTQANVAACQDLLHHFSRVGSDIYITGANLHIVNGTGTTDGDVNGLGNVIIGYNESRPTPSDDVHTGSHMLVVGSGNNYSSYGGIVVGLRNTASAMYASVSAGSDNEASGAYASVTGGNVNKATNEGASVCGGSWNTASGENGSVCGGYGNVAGEFYATVSGGRDNDADYAWSTCSGGNDQDTTANYDHRP